LGYYRFIYKCYKR